MSALEFSTFLSDISATIAQHVTTDGDASLASPNGVQDEHLAAAEALVRRATAAVAQVSSQSPSSEPSESPPPSPAQSAVDAFLLDHEKVVWHFPDVASRLIEDLH